MLFLAWVSPAFASDPPASLDPEANDLLLLGSGEWLQGDLDGIRDGTVYFDSKELENIEIDLVDVAEIHASRAHTYRFEGRRDILTGPAIMIDGELMITVEGGLEKRPVEALMTMIPGQPREWNYWNGMGSVGFTLRSGNTDQTDLSILTKLNRESALTRLLTTYNGSVSTQATGTTANSHRGDASFDLFVSQRLYIVLAALEVFADEFQNVDLRVTPNVGIGYDVIQHRIVTWSVGTGVGYQYTALKSVQAGQTKTSNDMAVLATTTLEVDPTSRIEWDTTYQLQLIATSLGKTNHHLNSILSVELLGPFDIDTTFTWDRLEQPQPASDGIAPVSDDLRIAVGLGFDF